MMNEQFSSAAAESTAANATRNATRMGAGAASETNDAAQPVAAERVRQAPEPTPRALIALRQLTKTYLLGQTRVPALRGVSLDIHRGAFVAIMGPSGSGKSTLMHLLGCLDRPSGGSYWLGGMRVSQLSPDALADVRLKRIGFVFQGFNLLSRSTALQNVQLPLLYAGYSAEEQRRRATKALQIVGLGTRLGHQPNQLSGGQQQRVAIARALVNGPTILLADEPTGNLDSKTSVEIMAVLQALNTRGLTIILVTHEQDIAAYARRQIVMRDGRVVRDEENARPRSAQAELQSIREAAAGPQGASARPSTPIIPTIRIEEEHS